MSLDQTTIKEMITECSSDELELVWIPRIMDNQTRDEIDYRNTLERNGMGLNGRDAPFITDLYNTVLNGRHLTPTRQQRHVRH